MKRPQQGDCTDYYLGYVALVPDGEPSDVVERLDAQILDTQALLAGVDDARGGHRYAPGKWSVKEVLGHVVDTERIFATRALCLARGETAHLPGFEQDDYVAGTSFDGRTIANLLDELRLLRAANVTLFGSFTAEELERMGTVNDSPMKVSAIPWIVAGHELHHRRVLQERYGIGAESVPPSFSTG